MTALTDCELLITRVIKAPRHLVFQAFTDPRHLPQWWGPDGFTTTTRAIDVRPGGTWRFIMHGPNGMDFENRIVYREIAAPERLVYDHDSGIDDDPAGFHVTVTFDVEGAHTRVTMRSRFRSAARVETVKSFGAVELGQQTLAHLEAQVEALRAGEGELDLVVTRLIHAARERVWQAWTHADELATFWGPRSATMLACELDARPGGALTITSRDAEGEENTYNGFIAELAAPERLAHTDTLNPDGTPSPEAFLLATITLEAQGDRTLVTARAHHYTAANRDLHAELGFYAGWGEMLERLDEVLTTA